MRINLADKIQRYIHRPMKSTVPDWQPYVDEWLENHDMSDQPLVSAGVALRALTAMNNFADIKVPADMSFADQDDLLRWLYRSDTDGNWTGDQDYWDEGTHQLEYE